MMWAEEEDSSVDVESETEEELMTSDEDVDDDDAQHSKAKKKKNDLYIKWNKKDDKWIPPAGFEDLEKRNLELTPEFSEDIAYNTEPYELVSKLFITRDILAWITNQTNLYNIQRSLNISIRNRAKPVTINEIETVIGVILYMGIVQLPNRRMYWNPKTRVDIIADAIAVNRFDEIVSMLHYNDNSMIPGNDSPDYDRSYKVRPILNFFRS